jgi:phasin family protein
MPSLPKNPIMRSGLDAQVNFLTDVTRRSYDSMRKLNALNLQFAQQVMQDAADAARNMLACSDPFQLAAAAAKAAQPASEHLRHYQQQLFNMLSGVQLDIARSAESFAPEAGRYASAMAGSIARDSDAFSTGVRESGPAAGTGRGYGGNGSRHTSG